MVEPQKSPLVMGKPRWSFKQMLLVFSLFPINGVLVLLLYASPAARSDLISTTRPFILFGAIAIWWAVVSLWHRRYGMNLWQTNRLLFDHRRAGKVPCPNCLVPLCDVESAVGEKGCPGCGCRIDGVEAMRAWKRNPKMNIPSAWDAFLMKVY